MLNLLKNTLIPCVLLQSQQAQASMNKMNEVFLEWSKQAGLDLTMKNPKAAGLDAGFGGGFGGARGSGGDPIEFEQRSNMILTMVDMLQLLEYGCWCYFDGDYMKGRGEPVDDFDNLCRQLHHNYVCASMDAEAEKDLLCLPWEADYQVFSFYSYSMDIEMECIDKNPNNECNQRACIIEMTFVLRLMQQYHMGAYPHDEYQAWAGFDVETCLPNNTIAEYQYSMDNMVSELVEKLETEIIDEVVQIEETLEEFERGLDMQFEYPEKMCCGRYPDRFPYKPKFGVTQCCGWRTYDTRILSCCDDMSLEMSCF